MYPYDFLKVTATSTNISLFFLILLIGVFVASPLTKNLSVLFIFSKNHLLTYRFLLVCFYFITFCPICVSPAPLCTPHFLFHYLFTLHLNLRPLSPPSLPAPPSNHPPYSPLRGERCPLLVVSPHWEGKPLPPSAKFSVGRSASSVTEARPSSPARGMGSKGRQQRQRHPFCRGAGPLKAYHPPCQPTASSFQKSILWEC